MPKKKFGPDDIFYNTVKTYPEYSLKYKLNESYINNRQSQGSRVLSGSISLYELNVDRPLGTDLIFPFITKGENLNDFVFTNTSLTSSIPDYVQLTQSSDIASSYPLISSVSREILIGNGSSSPYSGFEIIDGVSLSGSVYKIVGLENTFNKNKVFSQKFDFDEYYISGEIVGTVDHIQQSASPHQKYMSLFVIPEVFKGQRVNPGSVELNFYITGTLVATAKDNKRNGELIETFGPSASQVIGTVSYSEGIMVITGNYALNDEVLDGYLCPITGTSTTTSGPGRVVLQNAWRDNPKWAHFGAFKAFIKETDSSLSRSYAPASSSYEIKFEGTNTIPTMTMFCHADKNEMNWSNNLSYLDRQFATGSTYQEIIVAHTSSNSYKEKEFVPVKNTISSSFANYSASYEDQTFISKVNILDKDGNIIAIGKMAKPVTKRNDTDYTFKLKIDL